MDSKFRQDNRFYCLQVFLYKRMRPEGRVPVAEQKERGARFCRTPLPRTVSARGTSCRSATARGPAAKAFPGRINGESFRPCGIRCKRGSLCNPAVRVCWRVGSSGIPAAAGAICGNRAGSDCSFPNKSGRSRVCRICPTANRMRDNRPNAYGTDTIHRIRSDRRPRDGWGRERTACSAARIGGRV